MRKDFVKKHDKDDLIFSRCTGLIPIEIHPDFKFNCFPSHKHYNIQFQYGGIDLGNGYLLNT